MNKYQCQVCGAVSYSAASQENLKDNSCLECDGRVEMVDGDKMNADEIVKKIRSANICDIAMLLFGILFIPSKQSSARMEVADLIESLQAQLAASQRRAQDARNELCLKCGRYRESHNGACNRCRWKE
jgi:hypothetical protein